MPARGKQRGVVSGESIPHEPLHASQGRTKAGEVRVEGNLCPVVLLLALLDHGLGAFAHVVVVDLLELLQARAIRSLDHKLCAEDIGELGTKAVAATHDLANASVRCLARHICPGKGFVPASQYRRSWKR